MLRIKRSTQEGIYLANLGHRMTEASEKVSSSVVRIRDEHLPLYVRWQAFQQDACALRAADAAALAR